MCFASQPDNHDIQANIRNAMMVYFVVAQLSPQDSFQTVRLSCCQHKDRPGIGKLISNMEAHSHRRYLRAAKKLRIFTD